MGKVQSGFDCDRRCKELVAEKLKQETEKKNRKLIVDLHNDNDQEGIDIHMTSTTITDEFLNKLALELKERYSASTDQEFWFIELPKERKLRVAEEEGYKGLYSMYFRTDRLLAIWDINTWDKRELEPKASYKHTVSDGGRYDGEQKIMRRRWGVSLKSAIRQYQL